MDGRVPLSLPDRGKTLPGLQVSFHEDDILPFFLFISISLSSALIVHAQHLPGAVNYDCAVQLPITGFS
jgi:hypothetical protein